MSDLSGMIWVEARKAIRSRMPLWTALAAVVMPLGIAFLIFVSKNPEISQQLGLVSAKANLVAFAAADWPTYLNIYGQLLATAGLFLFVLVISWVFGREFADGTVKDLLAVPVTRASILLAKFIVTVLWSAALTGVILLAGLIIGARLGLPGGSPQTVLQGSALALITVCLVMAAMPPFAFYASLGRGYLLPLGLVVLTMMVTNLVAVLGWGEFFPWAVPGLYAQGKIALTPISYWIVALTGLAGMAATYFWWKYADQNR